MSEQKEITVRIAVCVDPAGRWSASGWGSEDIPFDPDAMHSALDGVGEGEARYWVEVTLPLPSVPVINAVAEPAR